ncbi:MAG: AGE family epimerase/isomerase, partial [Pseudomonadota bacterium]
RENLDLNHRPIDRTDGRVRVQARQTYSFTIAYKLGWEPSKSAALVEDGVQILATQCRRSDGLFGRRIATDGSGLTSDEADLYDTAFALFALAHAKPVVDTSDLIEETLLALDSHLADPMGGYREALPRPLYRLQNPHMHLFEACLALFTADGNRAHLDRASQLGDLCQTRFIDPKTGTLGERFDTDWMIPAGLDGGTVEPGHHFEWVWLFAEYAKLAEVEIAPEADQLYKFACATLDADGRAIQATDRAGLPADASRRTWPQTEALKAHLLMFARGDEAAGRLATLSFDTLMDEYLTPEGGWIDHYSADGQVLAKSMPASTLYHILAALNYLIDMVDP